MVDAKKKGNLVVMTKGGTKKGNSYYFALGETALYYFASDAVRCDLRLALTTQADRPKGEYKLNAFSNCAVLDEKKCIFELASPVKSIYLKVGDRCAVSNIKRWTVRSLWVLGLLSLMKHFR
jgi:hypothetical protein